MSIKYLIGTLLFASGMASAECFVKSSSISEMKDGIERVDAVQRFPIKLNNNQIRCSVTFNAKIRGKWYAVESLALATGSEDEVCMQAVNSGSARILEKIVGTKFTMQQEMVCTDQKLEPKKSVQVGELVRESDVQPDPLWPNPRKFKDGNECLRFVESDMFGPDLKRSAGVICRVDQNFWRVVDKF
jgi:hypothetical protein